MKFEEYLEKLGLGQAFAAYKNYIIWGIADFSCRDCHNFNLLLAPEDSRKIDSCVVACPTCGKTYIFASLSLKQQLVTQKRFEFLLSESSLEASSIATLLEGKMEVTTTSSSAEPGYSVPKPEGYATVGWIKAEEAQAVLESSKSEKKVEKLTQDGKMQFEVTWFPDSNREAQKYHSNTCLTRKSGKMMWIRAEEASAVLEALNRSKSIEFPHVKYGKGGLAEYFEISHPAATKYRSQVRLMRKR